MSAETDQIVSLFLKLGKFKKRMNPNQLKWCHTFAEQFKADWHLSPRQVYVMKKILIELSVKKFTVA